MIYQPKKALFSIDSLLIYQFNLFESHARRVWGHFVLPIGLWVKNSTRRFASCWMEPSWHYRTETNDWLRPMTSSRKTWYCWEPLLWRTGEWSLKGHFSFSSYRHLVFLVYYYVYTFWIKACFHIKSFLSELQSVLLKWTDKRLFLCSHCQFVWERTWLHMNRKLEENLKSCSSVPYRQMLLMCSSLHI